MKCPQCGNEMFIDNHRRIPIKMCYECGYTFDHHIERPPVTVTNFEHLSGLNLNELVAFLAPGIGIDESVLTAWLEKPFN